MLKLKSQNKDEFRRQAILAGVIVVSAVAYSKHRKIVNAAISAQQDLAFESMWTSFDEGVKYGLQLAKEGLPVINTETAKEISKNASEYAFGMFDKSA